MPDETQQTQAAETTATEAQAVTTGATVNQAAPDFEAWLSNQPEDVRKMYESHTVGLKSALDKERARNKKRDDEAARAAKESEDAKLSEIDRLKKQLKEAQDQSAELLRLQRESKAREALIVAAETAKIEFASRVAEQDALRFALESAEIDDDGGVKDAVKLIGKVITDRPYLARQQTTNGTTNAAARGKSDAPVIDKQTVLAWGGNPRYHNHNQ